LIKHRDMISDDVCHWRHSTGIVISVILLKNVFFYIFSFFIFPAFFMNKKRCINVHQKTIVTVKLVQID